MQNCNKISAKRPGAPDKQQLLASMIRVNHAGEYGAERIYAGQIAVLKNSSICETIKHMKKQEEEHLAYFSGEIIRRKVRPTMLMPVWHVAGFCLGAVTAMIGHKAAMACTVAVEEVIDAHYQEQLKDLETETALKDKISQFRDEEIEHRDIGLENISSGEYQLLRRAVGAATKCAIYLSKRI
jgi:ubiquinone biosynthesis monooxygenase Coq7